MQYTMVPNRFRQEPLDLYGYDRWQDQEGLVDATEACGRAWQDFGAKWRRARKADLARPAPAKSTVWKLSKQEEHGLRRARALGAAFAMCDADQRKQALSRGQRSAWFSWRSRCQRADLRAWQALWRLVDGDALDDVAAWFGEADAARLGGQCRLLLRWLLEELYPSTIR